MLVSEGMFEIVEGIDSIELNEIVNSDHREYVIDLNLEAYFDEDFNQENEREKKLLNPNKILQRKVFVDICEELLNMLTIENELNYVKLNKDIEKIEQIDKGTTCVLKKLRSNAEGKRKGIRGYK